MFSTGQLMKMNEQTFHKDRIFWNYTLIVNVQSHQILRVCVCVYKDNNFTIYILVFITRYN